jgi:hypothetical protein
VVKIARCGCGGSCGCNLEAGPNVTVGGTGAPANPWIVSALTNCPEVRNCITQGEGIDYDPGTGVVAVCISPDVGNNLALDANDCLYVPTGAATVTAGCGITGDGSGGDPVRANVGVWPYPCDVGTFGSTISCESEAGLLKGAPTGLATLVSTAFTRDYAATLFNTGTSTVEADTFMVPLLNPDTCRPSRVIIMRDVKFRTTLPGTGTTGPSTAGYSMALEETVRTGNTGPTTLTNMKYQTSRMFNFGTLAAGAASSYTLSVGTLFGSGGATYNRIEVDIRVIYISTT